MDYKILKSKITYTLAAVAVIGISFLSGAVEYIESFDVELTVHLDGSVDVVEHITVHSEGREIRRGIYRDIIAPRGATVRMDSVRRDGRDEP